MKYVLFLSLCFLWSCSNVVEPQDSSKTPVDSPEIMQIKATADSIILQAAALRKKTILRPISINIQLRKDFQNQIASQDSATDQEKTWQQALKVLGFFPETKSSNESQEEFLGTGVLGYYKPGTDSLFLVLDSLAPLNQANRLTLFHEAIHAIQDQHYPFIKLSENRPGYDEVFALRSIIEGEAKLLETYYDFFLNKKVWPNDLESIQNYFDATVLSVDTSVLALHKNNDLPPFTTTASYLQYFQGASYLSHKMTSVLDFSPIDAQFSQAPYYTRTIATDSSYKMIQNTTLATQIDKQKYGIYHFWGFYHLLALLQTYQIPNARTLAQSITADGFWIWGSSRDSLSLIQAFSFATDKELQDFASATHTLLQAKLQITLPALVENSLTHDKVSLRQVDKTLYLLQGVSQIEETLATFSTKTLARPSGPPSSLHRPQILGPYVSYH